MSTGERPEHVCAVSLSRALVLALQATLRTREAELAAAKKKVCCSTGRTSLFAQAAHTLHKLACCNLLSPHCVSMLCCCAAAARLLTLILGFIYSDQQ